MADRCPIAPWMLPEIYENIARGEGFVESALEWPHDSRVWLKWLRRHSDPEAKRGMLVVIAQQTLKFLNGGLPPPIAPGGWGTLEDVVYYKNASETEYLAYYSRGVAPRPRVPNTECRVLEMDSIDASHMLQDEGLNPVVLNMASPARPGGGWCTGARAQEECLFRRSNYSELVDPAMYPIPEFGAIYTPRACVFRTSEETGYQFLPTPRCSSFVAVAAYRCNNRELHGRLPKHIAEGMLKKIRSIFHVARHQGHDSLVLGALGCGAYGLPPHPVACIFHKVLQEFNGSFRKVVFAIIEDQSSRRASNPDGNLAPFLAVFHPPAEEEEAPKKPRKPAGRVRQR